MLPAATARNGVPQADGEAVLISAHWQGQVRGQRVPGGVVHKLVADLHKAVIVNATALHASKDIAPLAGEEFISWIETPNEVDLPPPADPIAPIASVGDSA